MYRDNYSVLLPVPIDAVIPDWYADASPNDIVTALKIGASLFQTLESIKNKDTHELIEKIEAEKTHEIENIKKVFQEKQEQLQSEIHKLELKRSELLEIHTNELNRLCTSQNSQVEDIKRQIKQQYELEILQLNEKLALVQQRYSNIQTAQEQEIHQAQERTTQTFNRVIEEKQRTIERLETQIMELNSIILQNSNEVKSLSQAIQTVRDQEVKSAEERTTQSLNRIVDEKERTIERLEKQILQLTNVITQNSNEIKNLSQALVTKKSQSTKEKGSDFEEEFRSKLYSTYGNCEGFSLESTANIGAGHAADHRMNLEAHQILWEVKNYDHLVPTKEVEKFIRDLKENPTAKIGVMVSRNTDITGKNKSGYKHIEFKNDCMLIYLNKFDSLGDSVLTDLYLLFKIFWYLSKDYNSKEEIETVLRVIEKLLEEAREAKIKWRQHKANNEQMVRWISQQVDSTEERLATALQSLQGNSKEKFDIPPGIFRDITGEDQKMYDYIRYILEVTDVNPEDSCILNDLAACLETKTHLTKDTIKSHIRGIFLDSVLQPQKGNKPARILGLRLKS